MGGKSSKPLFDPADVLQSLSLADTTLLQRHFRWLSNVSTGNGNPTNSTATTVTGATSGSTSLPSSPSLANSSISGPYTSTSRLNIERSKALQHLLAPLFPSFSSVFHERIFQVIDYNSNNAIDWDEYICFMYVALLASREDRLKFIFQCFDSTAANKIGKKEFKRAITLLLDRRHVVNNLQLSAIAAALTSTFEWNNSASGNHNSSAILASISSANSSTYDPVKEVPNLLDAYVQAIFNAYDRDNDKHLTLLEWKRYADDDDRISLMLEEMSLLRSRVRGPNVEMLKEYEKEFERERKREASGKPSTSVWRGKELEPTAWDEYRIRMRATIGAGTLPLEGTGVTQNMPVFGGGRPIDVSAFATNSMVPTSSSRAPTPKSSANSRATTPRALATPRNSSFLFHSNAD